VIGYPIIDGDMIFHTYRRRQEVLFLMMMVVIVLTNPAQVYSFSTISQSTTLSRCILPEVTTCKNNLVNLNKGRSTSSLFAIEDEDKVGELKLGDSESTLLGITGIIASLIMLFSESVLFRTGCGLPAGPAGLVGAAEGVSYLGVVVLVGFSLFTKIKTGKGLPPGPNGILGGAEGLAYLALLAGILVLVAQVTNYGYIPNAVPMEGGMCQ